MELTSVMTAAGKMEIDAQAMANQYLATILDENYRVAHSFFANGFWYFLIRYQNTAREPISTGAKLVVDVQNQAVIPLTAEQIQDLSESPFVFMAQAQGILARDNHGCVLRYQAKRTATAYLRENLSMHFSAIGGIRAPLHRPLWQFSIRFQMTRVGELESLGMIDVDTQTGKVIPLHNPQLQQIKQRVNAIIQHCKLASAA
jgi:hypothetical protein